MIIPFNTVINMDILSKEDEKKILLDYKNYESKYFKEELKANSQTKQCSLL